MGTEGVELLPALDYKTPPQYGRREEIELQRERSLLKCEDKLLSDSGKVYQSAELRDVVFISEKNDYSECEISKLKRKELDIRNITSQNGERKNSIIELKSVRGTSEYFDSKNPFKTNKRNKENLVKDKGLIRQVQENQDKCIDRLKSSMKNLYGTRLISNYNFKDCADSLKQEIENAKKSNMIIESEVLIYKQEIELRVKEAEQYRVEAEEYKKEIQKLKKYQYELNSLKGELEIAREYKEANDKSLETLKEQVRTLKFEVQASDVRIASLEEQLKEKQKIIDTLHHKGKELEKQRLEEIEAFAKASYENTATESKLKKCLIQNEELIDAMNTLKNEYDSLNLNYNETLSELKTLLSNKPQRTLNEPKEEVLRLLINTINNIELKKLFLEYLRIQSNVKTIKRELKNTEGSLRNVENSMKAFYEKQCKQIEALQLQKESFALKNRIKNYSALVEKYDTRLVEIIEEIKGYSKRSDNSNNKRVSRCCLLSSKKTEVTRSNKTLVEHTYRTSTNTRNSLHASFKKTSIHINKKT